MRVWKEGIKIRIRLTAEFIFVESDNPKDDNEVELARQLRPELKKLFSRYVNGWGISQPEITVEYETPYNKKKWQEIKEEDV